MPDQSDENSVKASPRWVEYLNSAVPSPESSTSEERGRIYTEYDDQGRSWVVVDGDFNKTQEWIGGLPDTWKRR